MKLSDEIDCPEVNLKRTKILLLPLDDDSVPNTQVNVPLDPDITVPKAHPLSALLGLPAPEYASNISAQPFVLLNPVVQVEFSGRQTKHPAYDPETTILNSDTAALVIKTWKYCDPLLTDEKLGPTGRYVV